MGINRAVSVPGKMLGGRENTVFLGTVDVGSERPVAYLHGDSHYFRIDKPFLNSKGQRLENFTRVETFGDNQANGTNDVNWLKVLVDPASREVFAYQPQIVPANRTPPLKRAAGDKSDLGRSAPRGPMCCRPPSQQQKVAHSPFNADATLGSFPPIFRLTPD